MGRLGRCSPWKCRSGERLDPYVGVRSTCESRGMYPDLREEAITRRSQDPCGILAHRNLDRDIVEERDSEQRKVCLCAPSGYRHLRTCPPVRLLLRDAVSCMMPRIVRMSVRRELNR
jgi:hypothetical protein